MTLRRARLGLPAGAIGLWLFAACFPEQSEHPLREPDAAGGAGTGGAAPGSGGERTSSGGTPSTTGGSAPATGSSAGKATGGAAPATGGSAGKASGGSAGKAGGGSAGKAAGGGAPNGGSLSSAGGSSAGEGGEGGAPTRPASGCSGKDYLICEDFESTDVGDVPEGWTRRGELAGVSDDAARAGERSLKLRPANDAERRIYHPAGLLGSAHWGRIYYKVLTPVPDAFVHSTLVSFTGDAPTRGPSEFRTIDTVKQAVDTRDVGSKHQYLYNVQVIGSSEFAREGPYDQEFENVWHCVEYHIDARNQSFALYVDGEEELSFENGRRQIRPLRDPRPIRRAPRRLGQLPARPARLHGVDRRNRVRRRADRLRLTVTRARAVAPWRGRGPPFSWSRRPPRRPRAVAPARARAPARRARPRPHEARPATGVARP